MAVTVDNIFRKSFFVLYLALLVTKCSCNDILGCGGFVKSHVSLDFSKIEIGLYTNAGSLKERTECAPNNGYYFLPLYEKGEYVLKVHPPPGWSFEPSQVDLFVDGVTDQCSTGQDVNFAFNGFGIAGRVITAGQKQGPGGISVQLIDDKGVQRDTVTTVGGDFHFTPVIPGKYTVKASHPRWKLEPSQAVVQVKEGNTALPVGVLAVKGYDVKGSISSYGSPISGVYVLLYSKEFILNNSRSKARAIVGALTGHYATGTIKLTLRYRLPSVWRGGGNHGTFVLCDCDVLENPKFRVEGCKTALLQGVPDAPICHSITDNSGEFNFGLVPAGEYRLLTLSTSPGQATVSYNVKPDKVAFAVHHDSLYIKNAFEVTGFKVVGTVRTHSEGAGLAGARVLRDGRAVGTTDAKGKFTLPELQPGVYTLSFQHEQCEFEDVQLTITPGGPTTAPTVAAVRWRACGAVTPPPPPPPAGDRTLTLSGEQGWATSVRVTQHDGGKWCTFLPPGVYSAKVDVSEQEQREGLQFYPLSQKITVANAPVDGIAFSQLKAKLTGRIKCKTAAACKSLPVTLRPLSPDGGYVGQPMSTIAENGEYTFEEVLPGSVEVSVPTARLCWQEARHNVAVTQERPSVPTFEHTGYVITLHSSHSIEVEYSDGTSKGVFQIPARASQQCVDNAAVYTLTPRGCHTFQPPQTTVNTAADDMSTVHFIATAHAVVIKVFSPSPVKDLVLRVNAPGHGTKDIGPLVPLEQPSGGYLFEHTLYMAEGETQVVSAWSRSLLFSPAAPVQVVGAGECQRAALSLRAAPALTLAGRLLPPVPRVTLTLTADDVKQTQVTTSEGTYRFGPLDASKHYTITAEKESYVFTGPDDKGDIIAHKLAEITVHLVDDADDTPLQSALVSVSGGTYRRNVASGPDGRLRFASLSPAEYYVKPNMKEYRFTPPHKIVPVQEGRTHHITLRGVRVAWSCVGRLVSLGGAGWGGAALVAVSGPADHCAIEEATTEPNGAFRIRGLLPNCVYTLQLKPASTPELNGLKLAKAPPTLEVKNNKDIENVRLIAVQPTQITDINVLVRTPNIDHYKSLRLTLALEATPHTPIYSTKLDSTGYNQYINPGLMYVLPRLPADNKTYVLQLESSLSKATHNYGEEVHYFNSDGKFKHFTIDFAPKVKSSEQELRQTSLLVVPLLGALIIAYLQREQLFEQVSGVFSAMLSRAAPLARPARPRPDVLDKASIDHILSTVNPPTKKNYKKKAL